MKRQSEEYINWRDRQLEYTLEKKSIFGGTKNTGGDVEDNVKNHKFLTMKSQNHSAAVQRLEQAADFALPQVYVKTQSLISSPTTPINGCISDPRLNK